MSTTAAGLRMEDEGTSVEPTSLPGVLRLRAPRYRDQRGWFAELWNAAPYAASGLELRFVQQNASWSRRGVLRGMHFQHPGGQGKLITVLSGTVYDAVVDVRRGSPTFGQWYGCELSDDNEFQLWIPAGFAHGFLVLSHEAIVHYACTAPYDAGADRGLAWDDAAVGIAWPRRPHVVSAKDRAAAGLRDLEQAGGALPAFEPPSRSTE
jgi:dTDP-4-dehydrorhamnose 3,5-epimerase